MSAPLSDSERTAGYTVTLEPYDARLRALGATGDRWVVRRGGVQVEEAVSEDAGWQIAAAHVIMLATGGTRLSD